MVKAALGKGMKDLISKNFGIAEEEPSRDDGKIADELKVNINRYHTQGYNVVPLKELKGKDAREIMAGIEKYRNSLKKLTVANTIIRSLEPYGYNIEIEEINRDIVDPTKADMVLSKVEKLKERALSEHNVKKTRKETPKVKLPQELGEKAERILGEGNRSKVEEDDLELDPGALDGMLNDLEDIGDVFDIRSEDLVEDQELLEKIKTWSDQGLFVDKLKTLLTEDIDLARSEADVFEEELKDLEEQKKRFEEMDLSNFKKQAEELKIKFQYPNMVNEIKNELDMMDKYLREFEKETLEREEAPMETPQPALEEAPEEKPEIQETPPEEEVPVPEPSEAPPEAPEEEPEPMDATPIEEDRFSDLSLDQLMDMAKETYRNGDNEGSLEYFHEILRRDPDNSKARFMTRRLSNKT
ncbi:MAG: hypothetical protein U9R75_06245 [Candidatus Thermoplasmatota archaeon]|nr:hypothetical protein [Candidatus Thermoplasmatota archaeon]